MRDELRIDERTNALRCCRE